MENPITFYLFVGRSLKKDGLLNGRLIRSAIAKVPLAIEGPLGRYCQYNLYEVSENCVNLEISGESHLPVPVYDPLEVVLQIGFQDGQHMYSLSLHSSGETLLHRSYTCLDRFDFLNFRKETTDTVEHWLKQLDSGEPERCEIRVRNQRVFFRDRYGEGMLYLLATTKKLAYVLDEEDFLMSGLAECFYSAATLTEMKDKQNHRDRLLGFIHHTYKTAISAIRVLSKNKENPAKIDAAYVELAFRQLNWIYNSIVTVLWGEEKGKSSKKFSERKAYDNHHPEHGESSKEAASMAKVLSLASELSQDTSLSVVEKVNRIISLKETDFSMKVLPNALYLLLGSPESVHKIVSHYSKNFKSIVEELHERAAKAEQLMKKGFIWRGSFTFLDNVVNFLRVRIIEDSFPTQKCVELKKNNKIVEHPGSSFVTHRGGYDIKVHKESISWRKSNGTGSEGVIVVEGDSFALRCCDHSLMLRVSFDSTESSIVHRIQLTDLLKDGKLQLV